MAAPFSSALPPPGAEDDRPSSLWFDNAKQTMSKGRYRRFGVKRLPYVVRQYFDHPFAISHPSERRVDENILNELLRA
jgi:hypothetical protein